MEKKELVRYGLFKGQSGNNAYLMDAFGDSKESLQKVKKRINQINNWDDLGELIAIIEEEYFDNGNGNFRKAELTVFHRAEELLSKEFQNPCQIACQIEIDGRRLISIRSI